MKKIIHIILFILLILIDISICGTDYYRVLGLPRNANEQQIKKAFKKLSLKYHPDKNKGNPKAAEAQFQKIVEAYEVLKDPEQKRIYDQYGEEGLKQHGQQQQSRNQGAGFDDIFSQFFGRGGGGGGGGFQFNFGGGGGGGFQQQQQGGSNIFDKSDVYELDMGGLSKFLRRQEVWVILFYKSNQKQSVELQDSYKELASKFYGILKIASIDCIEEDTLCEDEFQVFESPKIKVFAANIRSEGHDYKGNMKDIQKLANFAVSFMESYVRNVRESNYQEFINESQDKNIILLFTSKKSTPPLFRALSKEMNGKLVFGEIRQSESSLVNKFKVVSFPTILALTDNDNYIGVKYEGAYKKDFIKKFLREYAYTTKSANKSAQKPSEVKLLTPNILTSQTNCGNNDTSMCLIGIYDESNEQICKKLLEQLAENYIGSKLKFFYIDIKNIELDNIYESEDDDNKQTPMLIIVKGKRNKITKYNQTFNIENLKIFVDDILGGGGSFKNMHEQLNGNVFQSKKDDL
ncbi:hypothetical protein IMG5_138460 [Ichthyophthirius multifiliis]|uniref:DnaJ homolog subfamily C member 16 n=1 Tax=Ichthyophthirius multifiliis TaxID=5932 RepID=G0QX62_ICHMU|nr:hypothetical protein IMG5_138460 [Ichthyophthirius multifiliis]EGR30193.1 hypothetical protein IMG5_138460 [Ichthyophthirius multifiliis]|eukprot:XP_004031789.1 hypothetical protein IMG5_138460 [Ichthyophthirius multifiliis]